MDWLTAEILLFGIICALGITVIVYGVWAGNEIRRNQDTSKSGPSQDSGEPNTILRSAESTKVRETVAVTDAQKSPVRGKPVPERGVPERLKSLIQELSEIGEDRVGQDEGRRQQVALRIARVVIDEFQDENLPLPQDASTPRATAERTAEGRTTAEQDVESNPVKRSEAESQSSAR